MLRNDRDSTTGKAAVWLWPVKNARKTSALSPEKCCAKKLGSCDGCGRNTFWGRGLGLRFAHNLDHRWACPNGIVTFGYRIRSDVHPFPPNPVAALRRLGWVGMLKTTTKAVICS